MRALLLSSALVLAPGLASADPLCAIPDGAPVGMAEAVTPAVAPPVVPAPSPALDHVAASGARIEEAGTSHGLRVANARSGDQFTRLHVSPDGQAVVIGLMSELSVAELRAMAGGRVTELGVLHGLPGFFVPNGDRFQVYYATPDMQRVIPGAMFDASGKSLTRDQVASIPGAIPTVVLGDVPGGPQRPGQAAVSQVSPGPLLEAVEAAAYGTAGPASAPRLWVFVDPYCGVSVRALQHLAPYAAAGRVQIAVVPVAVLDREADGRSARAAKSLLTFSPDDLVAAWTARRFDVAAGPEAQARLARNAAVAAAIGLRGTPTFVWRKADGTEARADGLPDDLGALVASVAR